MIESGNYVDIHYQEQDFYKKPAGINWLQAGVVKTAVALGMPSAMTSIWVYRIPSLIGAVAAVLLTYWTALAVIGRRPAVLAALMLAASVMFDLQGRLARTDEVLMAVFLAALGAMARIYLAERRTPETAKGWLLPAIFWTAIAAGVLLKGPFILLFMGLIAAVLVVTDRSIRWVWTLRPIPGVIWLVVLLLPWVAAIVSRTGMSFFANSIGHDMLGKVAEGQEFPRRAAGLLSRALRRHLLSRRRAGDAGRPPRLGAAARTLGTLPAGLDRAGLDHLRTGADQAAPLRAAALPGHRNPDRRGHRTPASSPEIAGWCWARWAGS